MSNYILSLIPKSLRPKTPKAARPVGTIIGEMEERAAELRQRAVDQSRAATRHRELANAAQTESERGSRIAERFAEFIR